MHKCMMVKTGGELKQIKRKLSQKSKFIVNRREFLNFAKVGGNLYFREIGVNTQYASLICGGVYNNNNNNNNNNFRVSNTKVSNRTLIYNVCPEAALT